MSENSNMDFLHHQDNVGSLDHIDTALASGNSVSIANEAQESTTIPPQDGPMINETSPARNQSESPTLVEVEETSSPGHVTLQSFLEAISQNRLEDPKVEPTQNSVTEGPFLLPFRTTLRTTTIATTTTTTQETTTAGKPWLITV